MKKDKTKMILMAVLFVTILAYLLFVIIECVKIGKDIYGSAPWYVGIYIGTAIFVVPITFIVILVVLNNKRNK